MIPVGIAGIGLVSSAGWTPEDAWNILTWKESTVSPLRPEVGDLVRPKYGFQVDLISDGSRLVDMARIAIKQAMGGDDELSHPDALCLGSTTAGFRDNQAKGLGKPYYKKYLTPGAIGEEIASEFEIPEVFQFSQACASSGYAIAVGCDLISQGHARVVLAGGVDELTACVVDAFSECRIYGDGCRPFDEHRRGLLLGEAAAFVILVHPDLLKPYLRPCFITGIGLTCDANDMATPYSVGVARAIEDATSGIAPGFIVAHATGTKAGDLAEASAIHLNGFGRVPTASYKGALGHPQGASGAVGVVLGAMSYYQAKTFPTVGCEEVGSDMPPINVCKTSRMMMDPNYVLCLSSGTWGVNSAILLGKHRDTRGVCSRDRTGIVTLHPTVEWPGMWASKSGRVKATEFGLTVSNAWVGEYAIEHELLGPQITLAYGDPTKVARLQLEAGRASSMLIADDYIGAIVDDLR